MCYNGLGDKTSRCKVALTRELEYFGYNTNINGAFTFLSLGCFAYNLREGGEECEELLLA